MKSRNKRHYIKPLLITLVVLILATGSYFAYRHFRKNGPVASDGPTAEQVQEASDLDVDNKKQFLDNNPVADTPADQPNTEQDASISVTANQDPSSSVTLITKLSNVPSGTCTLNIVNGVKSLTRSAAVIYQPEFSTCAGFTIPVNELGTGTWNITLSLSGARSSTKTLSFEVK